MAFKKRNSDSNQEQKRIHAYVATPAYDGRVMTDYALSMTEAAGSAALLGIQVTAAVMGNGAFIEIARCNFVRMFLETDCTHLFFIDSDLKFEARAFVGLLMANKPVVAGMYRRRQEPEDYPVKLTPWTDGGGLWVDDEGWVMCDRVPTGFLCIRRDVIEQMAAVAPILAIEKQPPAPLLFDTQRIKTGERTVTFLGEDFSFCDNYVQQFGEPIAVWPDMDFTHGGYECNFAKYLNREVEREQAEMQAAAGPSGTDQTEAAA